VHEALALQQGAQKGKRLGEILIEMGILKPEDIVITLSGMLGLPFVSLRERSLSEETLKSISAEMARSYQVVPVDFDAASKRLVVALKGPDNFRAIDDLRNLMGMKVSAVVAPAEDVEELLKKHYTATSSKQAMADVYANLQTSDAAQMLAGRGDSIDLATLGDAANDNSVVTLLNLVLLQAIKDKASDIHFEPASADEATSRHARRHRLPRQGHRQDGYRREKTAPGRPRSHRRRRPRDRLACLQHAHPAGRKGRRSHS